MSLAAFPPSLPPSSLFLLAWEDGRKGEMGWKMEEEEQHWINSTHEAGRMTAETQLFLRAVLA